MFRIPKEFIPTSPMEFMPTTPKEKLQMAVNVLIILLALWLIASPFVFNQPKGAFETTMEVVFGGLIFVIAYFCAMLSYRQAWVSCINIVFGILLLTSQKTMHFPPNATLDQNHTCTGIAVIILASISALLAASSKKAAS